MKKIFTCLILCLCVWQTQSGLANEFVEAAAVGDMQALERVKTDINVQNEFGYTALMKAAYGGHINVVEKLIRWGANAKLKTKHGYTALMLAAASGHLDIVRALLGHDANINAIDGQGQNALDYALRAQKTDVANFLVKVKDITDFMQAAKNGDVAGIKNLLQKGVDVNVLNRFDYSALLYAAKNEHMEAVKLLLDSGANVNHKEQKALGSSALSIAATKGNLPMVELLLQKGAQVDIQDTIKGTPLHNAARKGHTKVIEYLLTKNANIKQTNSLGDTALMLAAEGGHVESVQLLLKHGIDASIKNRAGKNALMLAQEKGHTAVVSALAGAQSGGVIFADIASPSSPSNKNSSAPKTAPTEHKNLVTLITGDTKANVAHEQAETPQKMEKTESAPPANVPVKPKIPDYGLYTALVNAYLHQFGPLQAQKHANISDGSTLSTWGLLHLKLDDLNGDGIKELILVRVHKHLIRKGEYETIGLASSKRKTMQIFSINSKDGGMYHVASSDLFEGIGDYPGWGIAKYATRNGLKYIVTGEQGSDVDVSTWWRMQGGALKATVKMDSSAEVMGTIINGKRVSEATAKSWYKHLKDVVLNHYSRKELAARKRENAKVIDFLAQYPPTQGNTAYAYFNGNRFVIFEDTPNTDPEGEVAGYFKYMISRDVDTLTDVEKSIRGFIIEEFLTYTKTNIKKVSSRVGNASAKDAQKLGLSDYKVVCVVHNMRTKKATASGIAYLWFLVGQKAGGNEWRVYQAYD